MTGTETEGAGSAATLEAVERFNEALERRDFEALAATMTEDCVFEDTGPRPDGRRYRGRDAVTTFFEDLFERSPGSRFEVEDIFACGDRCVVLWNHRWEQEGRSGNNRGIDVFRIREGRVAEKLAYTKHG